MSVYASLSDMIADARLRSLWFYQPYQSLWLSPDELGKANSEGRLRFGPVNWELRDPDEGIAQLQRQVDEALSQVEAFKRRVTAWRFNQGLKRAGEPA